MSPNTAATALNFMATSQIGHLGAGQRWLARH